MNSYYNNYSQPTTPNSVSKADPTGPGLMNFQKEKYGAHLFQKNDDGNYTCFFKDCGKQFAANFSRHISKHESEGTPLDPQIKLRPVTPPLQQSPHLQSHQPQQQQHPHMTPMKQQIPQPVMTTPQHHQMAPPMGMNAYGTPNPSFGFSIGMISPQNPLSAYIDPLQQQQVQQQPSVIQQAQQQAISTPTTRSSIKNNAVNGGPPGNVMSIVPPNIDQANMMDKKGIPYQICQHPLHEKWWGTANILPSTEFYTRASKCKKCYIKQQQDSKKLRTQNATGIGSVVSSMENELSKTSLARSNTLNAIGTPNKQIYLTPQIYQQISSGQNIQSLLQKQYTGQQFPHQQQQQQLQMQMQGKYPGGPTHIQYLPGNVIIGIPPQSPFAPKVNDQIIFRPRLEPNYMEVNRNMLEKCKNILVTLAKDSRSKYFREPVDAVKLQLPNYHEIIKEPMDFSTVDKRLNFQNIPTLPEQQPPVQQLYSHYLQFDKDMKLVFKNAMTFNKEDTDVYELADELEKEYEELFEQALEDVENDAALNTEMINICATCKKEPVPYQKTVNVDANGINADYDDNKPTPLLVCDGSCLRAFHLHCLKLPLDTKGPWLCRDCSQGRPVLHYDQIKNEYFYYYYEGLNTDENKDSNNNDRDDESDDSKDKEMIDINQSNDNNSNDSLETVSDIGVLDKVDKVKIRNDEETHRMKDMYFDPIWCMWRCKSKVALKHREDRQEKFFDKSKDSNQKPKSKVIKKKKSKKRYGY